MRVNKQPQSLTVILKDAIEVITPQAQQKQITIIEQLTPVFYQTLADRDMLYQAALNLLSNAVKYTPSGGTISIQTVVDETQRKVLSKIIDTGVGIPPKDLPFIFDKFYRAEANNRMATGTGLGSVAGEAHYRDRASRTHAGREPGRQRQQLRLRAGPCANEAAAEFCGAGYELKKQSWLPTMNRTSSAWCR